MKASISPHLQVPFIGRKGYPTQNVMAACDFNMLFTFVWAGWEGSAHDTRIFNNALNSDHIKFPKPPTGTYLNSFFIHLSCFYMLLNMMQMQVNITWLMRDILVGKDT